MLKKEAKKSLEISYDIGLANIAAKVWGQPDGDHLYVGVHGWLDNASTFDALFGALEGPCVAIDLIGHGLSSHRPSGCVYHLSDYALILKKVMDQLDCTDLTLVGHSMGTSVVLEAALLEKRVRRLILIDGLGPFTHDPSQWSDNFKASAEKHLEGPKPSPVFNDFDEATVYRQKSVVQSLDADRAKKLMERSLKPRLDGKLELSWDRQLLLPSLMRMTEEQVKNLCGAIKVPILAFAGKDGPMTLEYMKRADWFADIELHVLPGDHYLHMGDGAEPLVDLIEKVND